MIHQLISTQCEMLNQYNNIINNMECGSLYIRYRSKHQAQFFGRGHIAGIDIKVIESFCWVCVCVCVVCSCC